MKLQAVFIGYIIIHIEMFASLTYCQMCMLSLKRINTYLEVQQSQEGKFTAVTHTHTPTQRSLFGTWYLSVFHKSVNRPT